MVVSLASFDYAHACARFLQFMQFADKSMISDHDMNATKKDLLTAFVKGANRIEHMRKKNIGHSLMCLKDHHTTFFLLLSIL